MARVPSACGEPPPLSRPPRRPGPRLRWAVALLLASALPAASILPSPGPLVLYGSQTGTAEDVAWHIVRGLASRGLDPRCMAMDRYRLGDLAGERLVVCVAATTGEGEAPRNMLSFWQALRSRALPGNALGGLEFAVFGLGDSSYRLFNAAARRLDTRLGQLGARRLLPCGLGDDQAAQGEDTALTPWLEGLWMALGDRGHLLRGGGLPPKAMLRGLDSGSTPDGGGVLRGPMGIEEARRVVGSVAAMSDVVLFSRGDVGEGGKACGDSVAMARELRGGGGGGFAYIDCLREQRVAEALSVAYAPPPIVFRAGKTAESGDEGVGGGVLGVGGGGGARCLNDAWEGVGGEGHRWGAGGWVGGDGWGEARVAVVERLSSGETRAEGADKRHVVLAVPPMLGGGYAPGDVVYVMPRNRARAVEDFLWTMGLDGASRLVPAGKGWGGSGVGVRAPCTVLEHVSGSWDLDGRPRRRFVRRLAGLASSPDQRERLEELCEDEGAWEDYMRGAPGSEGVTIAGLLRDFDSVRPGWEALQGVMPPLKPRAYSIASSPVKHPGEIHICLSVSRSGPRLGVCSSFLLGARPGDAVPVSLSPGSLGLALGRACVLVGPGTGIAPFRSFLWERHCGTAQGPGGRAEVVAFFGNRRREGDFLYGAELGELEGGGGEGLRVHVAFSRDAGGQYVQDLIRERKKDVWRVIVGGGGVHVAGARGAMPRGVREAIEWVVGEEGGVEDPAGFVRGMLSEGRYREECW